MSEPGLPTFSVTDAQYKALLPVLREVARAEETQRLARALALSLGFSFHIAICETPLIAQSLILCLAREVPTLSGSPTRMTRLVPTRSAETPLSSRELAKEIFEGLLGTAPSAEPQISFLDATDSRSDDNDAWLWLFQRLNERRNHLYAIGHPLVFLLPPALAIELMRFAPDLWSIRSANVRISGARNAPEPRAVLPLVTEDRWIPSHDLVAQRTKVDKLLTSSGPHGQRALMVEFRRLAEALHERGETERALQLLHEEILPLVDRAQPPELKAGLMADIVETLVRLDQAEEAEQLAREHVLPHLADRAPLTQVMMLARLAEAYRFSGEQALALKLLLQEALPLATRLSNDEAKAGVLSRAVISYLRNSQLQLAQQLLEQHEKLLEQWLPPLEYAYMNLQLAEAQRANGEADTSLDTLRQRVVPNVQHDARMQALAWHATASAYRQRGDLQQALQVLRGEALPIYQKLGNIDGRVMAHLTMAEIQLELGQRKEALRLLRDEKKALRNSIPSSHKEAMERAALIELLASGLHTAGEPREAEDLLRAELQAPSLDAGIRAWLQARLVLLETADARGLDDVPERRHTCAGPEVYHEPG